MTTRVRVAVRARPLIPKEIDEGCENCITTIDETQLLLGKDKCFTFDYVFGCDTSQDDVFHNCTYPLIEAIFKGFNATMLAYGQTGSGKTFTMGTNKIVDTDEQVLGIIPRVVEHLFSLMDEKKDKFEYSTKVSFLEIYNEELKDLLNADTGKELLSIREDSNGIKISGLTEESVGSPTEALNLLCKGGDNRAIGATKMNEQSSRSHAIFTLHIEQRSRQESDDFWTAKFHLVDLAGSERIKKTGAEGDRRKEGININLGLLALGNVVSALCDDKKRKHASHIPYRDSKLTRLLQDSLGGNSYTLMMACISPADSNMEETLNTLRYADRAKRIKNKPTVNRDPHVAEILRLKALVAELQGGAVAGTLQVSDPVSSLEARKLEEKCRLLEEQNEKLTTELTNAIDHSTELCERIVVMEHLRDKMKNHLHKVVIQTGISLEELDTSLQDPNINPDIRERLEKVKSLQEEIAAIDSDKMALEASLSEVLDSSLTTVTELTEQDESPVKSGSPSQTDTETADSSATITPNTTKQITSATDKADAVAKNEHDVFAKTYTLHRAKMSRQLKELDEMLTAKQAIISQSVTATQKKESLKKQQHLEAKIKQLEDEKDKLQQQISGSKASSALSKVSEQRRLRLKELEQQMTDLKGKLKEQSRIVKMKEQTDKQLEKLNKEIVSMKQQRVKLMKQIKEESEKFRRWKVEQDKKVMQLKARDRKMQCEIAKMEVQHSKAQAFYKRKAEEAAQANKRLKDVLEKQQAARELKSCDREMSNLGPRIKSMIHDEVDMQVSVKEAERMLNEQMVHRADLNKEMQALKSSDSSSQKLQQIKLTQSQLRLCSAQIAEFNQKLQDAKSTKTQPLSERIVSMVEARCVIRHLLNAVVSSKVGAINLENQNKELSSSATSNGQRVEQLEKELNEMEEYHMNEIKVMKQDFDRKTVAMKKKLERVGGSTTDLHVNSMDLNITALNEEIEEKNRKIEELERKLAVAAELSKSTPHKNKKRYSYMTGTNGELFPDLGIAPSPFLDKVNFNISSDAKVNVKVKARSKIISVPENDLMEIDSEESDIEKDDPADLSWHATPEVRRMRRMSSFSKCSCTTKCARSQCSCRTNSRPCGPLCGCLLQGCLNDHSQKASTTNTSPDSSSVTTAILNSTYTKDSDDSLMDTSNTSPDKKLKRNESTSNLALGKRRKLLSKENHVYAGSPV